MKNIKIVITILGVTLLMSVYALHYTSNKSDSINTKGILDKVKTGTGVDSREGVSDEKLSFDFRLNDINGVPHSLSDYKGKKVYLKYWASWCPICLAGMDEFDQLVKSNASSAQIVVLSVVSPGAYGEKSDVEFLKWYKERGYAVTVLMDSGGTVARKIGIRAFPTSVYIDSNGHIIAVHPGQISNEMITDKLTTFK